MLNGWTVLMALVLACMPMLAAAQEVQVGSVQGKPVLAGQVAGETEQARAERAQTVFMLPVMRAWFQDNAGDIRLTHAEAEAMAARIDAYSDCSGNGYALPESPAQRRMVVDMLGGNIKAQKLLHDRFGGGRLLFQQAGIEAFDATRRMLEAQEAAGVFTISDAHTRRLAYQYWTRDQSPFLIDDPEQIRKGLDLDTVISECPAT